MVGLLTAFSFRSRAETQEAAQIKIVTQLPHLRAGPQSPPHVNTSLEQGLSQGYLSPEAPLLTNRFSEHWLTHVGWQLSSNCLSLPHSAANRQIDMMASAGPTNWWSVDSV